MASVSKKYKEAQERWIQHCHDIERSTAKIPKGTEQERKNRIARARKRFRGFTKQCCNLISYGVVFYEVMI